MGSLHHAVGDLGLITDHRSDEDAVLLRGTESSSTLSQVLPIDMSRAVYKVVISRSLARSRLQAFPSALRSFPA